MKFSVSTKELNEALSVVTKALSPNAEQDILKGIYFSIYGNELFLKCSDSSIQIETIIPAMGEEDGAAVLPGRLTFDLVRRMRGSDISFETVEGDIENETRSIKLTSGKSRSSMQFFDAETYPNMDEIKGDTSFRIKQNLFRSMIRQTVFCCAGEEESRAVLRGVFMEFTEEGDFNMVALDGFRLAKRTEKLSVSGAARNAVVPSRTMQDIANILYDTDDEVLVTISMSHITVDMGTTKIKARLVKGDYINYRNVLSKKSTSRVTAIRDELRKSLEISSLIAKETQNSLIKLTFDEDNLHISARSEKASINENMEISMTGTPIEISFNASLLLDVIKNIDDEAVAISLNTSVTPCIIEPVQGNSYYYLVLPVRTLR